MWLEKFYNILLISYFNESQLIYLKKHRKKEDICYEDTKTTWSENKSQMHVLDIKFSSLSSHFDRYKKYLIQWEL